MGQFVIWQGKRYLVKSCFQDSYPVMGSNIFGQWWVTILDDEVKVFGQRNVPATEVTSWEPNSYLEAVVTASEHDWSLNYRSAEYNQYELLETKNDRLVLGTAGYVELMQIYTAQYEYNHVAFLIDLAIQWHEEDNK